MATPMTAAQIVSQLKKWNVQFQENQGWRTHNRNKVGKWGPVNGGMMHHVGDDGPDDNSFKLVRAGRKDLPGPLCHFGLRDNGKLDLVGWGRANHAGGGDPEVLQQVINESYKDYPRTPRFNQSSNGARDGNQVFYGMEAYYSGKAKMTDAAYKTAVLTWAAVCDFHKWSSKSIIGHKEWSNWKIDPGSMDMKVFRADIQRALKAGHTKAHTIDYRAKPAQANLTPNITAALAANVAYRKALAKISNKGAQAAKDRAVQQATTQYNNLRKFEITK